MIPKVMPNINVGATQFKMISSGFKPLKFDKMKIPEIKPDNFNGIEWDSNSLLLDYLKKKLK